MIAPFSSAEQSDIHSLRQQHERFVTCEVGRDRFVQELKEATPLLAAGGDGGPHTFVVSLALFATSPLSHATVDHAVTYLLFAMVVGRFNTRLEHKAKIVP